VVFVFNNVPFATEDGAGHSFTGKHDIMCEKKKLKHGILKYMLN